MPCDEWIRFDMEQNAIVKLNGLDGIYQLAIDLVYQT